jgi:hypothetical protein
VGDGRHGDGNASSGGGGHRCVMASWHRAEELSRLSDAETAQYDMVKALAKDEHSRIATCHECWKQTSRLVFVEMRLDEAITAAPENDGLHVWSGWCGRCGEQKCMAFRREDVTA